MKLDIVEACRIRSVVGTAFCESTCRTSGYDASSRRIRFCQLNGLIQGNTLRQGGTDINRTFVQLRKKLSPSKVKHHKPTAATSEAMPIVVFLCAWQRSNRNGYPVYPRQKRIMPFTHSFSTASKKAPGLMST